MHGRELIIKKAEIVRRVRELGRQISRDYQGRDLVVVGILKGAFIFMADLVRVIDLDLSIDFLRLSSYGQNDFSAGEITVRKDVELDIGGRHVLLVEDIADTGHTLAFLRDFLAGRRPRSIRICVFIDKQERRTQDITVDYIGFSVDRGFLVGYGLDYGERYRHLAQVYSLTGH
jgi:hypoxanthine phosphoribosyltransferase